MQGKRLLSLIMMVAIGTVSMSTSTAGHNTDLDGRDDTKELSLIMAAADEQELTAKAMASTSPCISKDGWSGDLTLQGLNEMMKTFLGVRWGTTYIFAPQCPDLDTQGHVYASGGGSHAEDNMAAQCGLPTEFYLTSAPCPDCAMMLYNRYKTKSYKPLIHIARPYQGKGKEGSNGNKKVNLHCLAMLMQAGFTIVPWSWVNFEHNYITNDNCKEAIDEMISDSDLYNMRYNKAMAAIQQAMDMMTGGNHNYKACNDAANTVNGERYAANNERYAANAVNNERYTVNNERYAVGNNEMYGANTVNDERYTANPVNNERYAANNERYTVNDERYAANNERYTAGNNEMYAANTVNNERYTANPVNNERYAANNERYTVNNERYAANNERYAVNNERYAANNERYSANTVNNERYQ